MSDMVAVVTTSCTEDLATPALDAIRRLLDASFGGRFDDHDWEHSLGGHHVVVSRDGMIVAHAAVVRRSLWLDDQELDVGYVEGVAAAVDVQGTGLGTTAMRAAADVIGAHHEVGALSTGEWHFYERLGWRRWRGPTFVRRADGTTARTPEEDDGIMILLPDGAPAVDLTSSIVCRERVGDDW